MFFLYAAAEFVLLGLIIFLLALYAPPLPALIISIVLALLLYFFRPARYFDKKHHISRRMVLRRGTPATVPDQGTIRPADGLTPAEVFRLMEIVGAVPRARRNVADFTATLLDLNRRGLLSLPLGEDGDLLHGDGIRVVFRLGMDTKKLEKHERILIGMLKRTGGSANSVQLSAFAEAFTRFPILSCRKTDAFRDAVDRTLRKKRLLARRKKGLLSFLSPLYLTGRGERCAAFWRVYFRNICTHPFVDSYRPSTAEQAQFAKDAEQILVDAAACGYCAKTAECLQREYVFDPMEIWRDGQYFGTMTESRTAFSESADGEEYFFLPLHDFEAAIRTVIDGEDGTENG